MSGRRKLTPNKEAPAAAEDPKKKPHVWDREPCGRHGHTRLWLSVYGRWVCEGCHPPASPALVAEWFDSRQPKKKEAQ